MKIFKLNEKYSIVCESEKTRYGFRHIAVLCDEDGNEIDRATKSYLNRTWERYEFQSVLKKLVNEHFENEIKDYQRSIEMSKDKEYYAKKLAETEQEYKEVLNKI